MTGDAGEREPVLSSTTERIDSEDRFTFVDENWLSFARENWIAGLAEKDIIGRSLWDYISDAGTRRLWRSILQRVRAAGRTVRVPYRCDSPGCRRFLMMVVEPGSRGVVEMLSRVLREEPREPVSLLDASIPRGGEPLTICSWCKRVCSPKTGVSGDLSRWLAIEDAVAELGLFELEVLPDLRHEVCEECYALVVAQVEQQTLRTG